MKIKAKTKKLIVLSVMVVLLVATGVLNFVLNDRLDTISDQASITGDGDVTQTFFAACRSDRNAVRESEFLCLDAISSNPASSAEAKKAAEAQKLMLVTRMENESLIETSVKAKGFPETIATINDNGINIIVVADNLTGEQATQVMKIAADITGVNPRLIKVMSY